MRQWIIGSILLLLGVVLLSSLVIMVQGRYDALPRIAAIGIAGVVAALLCIPLAMLAARPSFREAGVAGIATLSLQVLLISLSAVFVTAVGSDALLGAAFLLLLPGLAALSSLSLLHQPGVRHLAMAGVSLAAIAAALSVAPSIDAAVRSTFWENWWIEARIFGQVISVTTLLLLAAAWRRPAEPLMAPFLASIAPLLALLVTGAMILHARRTGEERILGIDPPVLLLVCWSIAVGVSLARPMRVARLQGSTAFLPAAFIACVIASGVILAAGAGLRSDVGLALGGTVGVIAASLFAIVALVGWFNWRVEVAAHAASITPGEIGCPRCHGVIVIRPGSGQCLQCGLRYKLTLESPQCRVCRQDLMKIQSDRCPECGELIRHLATGSRGDGQAGSAESAALTSSS
ncbi:MAG: hypothetical protein KF724_03910 [Phycisphaeraceae bacterium]|nr:hypothetical protein [Phycisphaeraceae bacterium]